MATAKTTRQAIQILGTVLFFLLLCHRSNWKPRGLIWIWPSFADTNLKYTLDKIWISVLHPKFFESLKALALLLISNGGSISFSSRIKRLRFSMVPKAKCVAFFSPGAQTCLSFIDSLRNTIFFHLFFSCQILGTKSQEPVHVQTNGGSLGENLFLACRMRWRRQQQLRGHFLLEVWLWRSFWSDFVT